MPEWMTREPKDKERNAIEIKPELITGAMKPELDKLKTEFSSALADGLKPMNDFFTAQRAKDEETARRAKAAERKEAADKLEINPEDWITDPEGAARKLVASETDGLKNTVAAQSAIIMRDRVLGKRDYYASDPTFQAKVDALIDAQPMQNRANSSVIDNAYKSVFYDMQEDIKAGKIKSLASAASMSNNGSGAHSGSSDKDKSTTLSAAEKEYARKMGLTEAQWIQGGEDMEYV